MTFTQSTKQIEAEGIRESLYFRNQRVKKNDLGGQRSRNEKCLYSSREYVYKVSLSSDDSKSTILPNVTDGRKDGRTDGQSEL